MHAHCTVHPTNHLPFTLNMQKTKTKNPSKQTKSTTQTENKNKTNNKQNKTKSVAKNPLNRHSEILCNDAWQF